VFNRPVTKPYWALNPAPVDVGLLTNVTVSRPRGPLMIAGGRRRPQYVPTYVDLVVTLSL